MRKRDAALKTSESLSSKPCNETEEALTALLGVWKHVMTASRVFWSVIVCEVVSIEKESKKIAVRSCVYVIFSFPANYCMMWTTRAYL